MQSKPWVLNLFVPAVLPLLAFVFLCQALAQPDNGIAILPPALKWNGRSQSLVAPKNDPWITPAEQSDFVRTPRYAETVNWLRKLVEAAPELEMISLGKSPEGRDLWMIIASKEQAFTPAALRATGKPVFFAQAGIHAGEIDGKDAGMMLLRDLTVRNKKRALLDKANFLFLPIFNVDGHERFSAYTRINQRGPAEAGWRTTSRNLNLNRDYAKMDAPEMQALVRALNEWNPDLYFDIHVTDGSDYQYDITYGYIGDHAYSPAGSVWMDQVMSPALDRELNSMGHIPGPLIFPANFKDYQQGLVRWTAGPRFSDAYGNARHLPTVLIENHSLKPYRQRVLGTYVLLEAALRVVGQEGEKLRAAIAEDRNRRMPEIPLTWRVPNTAPETMTLLSVESRMVQSKITGSDYLQWTGKPEKLQTSLVRMNEPASRVRRPKAYWIPPAWKEVIERLAIHGIQMEKINAPREVEAEMYRIHEAKLAEQPFEGRVHVTGKAVAERRRHTFPAGAVRLSTDQPLGTLAVLLLEPDSPDSFFQWGFFLEILTPTEYVEEYVMQPMAERMLSENAQLRAEFEQKVESDSIFARNPQARLHWLYQRTPFFDEHWRLYPVAREL